jgi:hypothetical protein
MRISSGIGLLGSAFAMAAVFAGASGLAQAQEIDMIAPHQHAPASIVRIHDGGVADSTNWSGYAVTGANGSVTSVTGSWIVPASTCTKGSSPEYSSFWVGIDGWTSKTVEQTGTDSDCRGGKPHYYAWYEFYPEPSYNATGMADLTPGDKMSATVSWDETTRAFTLTITDETADLTFTKTFTPVLPRARSSAEWIAEAPASSKGNVLPLANFGTVYLGQDYTSIAGTNYATISGVTGGIGSFGSNVWMSDMINETSSVPMATPSILTNDGSSFLVTWYSVGP